MATILVVDDDRAIRDVVCFALTRAGFAVQQAGDGATALQQFRTAPADLILLDILMPELDGTDVCRTPTRAALPRRAAGQPRRHETGIRRLQLGQCLAQRNLPLPPFPQHRA